MKSLRIHPTSGALAAAVLLSSAAGAQQYVISTYAGGAPPPTPAPALSTSVGWPSAVAVDSSASVYFASPGIVFRLDPDGTIARVAGNSRPGYSGDGGPAINAQVSPSGLAVDGAGNLFIADTGNHRIRKVSPNGIITTVAGNGISGFSGDGGPAAGAQLLRPGSVAVDGAGNLFIADTGNKRIRKVSADGLISTVAGGGATTQSPPTLGDGGPATSAFINLPQGLALDASGNLFVTDYVIAEQGYRIRKVSPGGIITTVARGSGQGALANAVAVDGAGTLFITEQNSFVSYFGVILKIAPDGSSTKVAGGGTVDGGDGVPATSVRIEIPTGVAVDRAGNLFITDYSNRVRKVSPDGMITTVAGSGNAPFSGDGGPAASAQLSNPVGVAVDAAGSLYLADLGNQRVRKVSPARAITTVAGVGTAGYSGDGGQAASSQLNWPAGVAADNAGNVFILDFDGNRVRKVAPSGIITTVAGNGTGGFSGDGGPATTAQLSFSCFNTICGGLAVDSAGNLYVADSDNGRVRRISAADGVITTVAGNGGSTFSGDGGPATSAELGLPTGLAVDAAGNLFIADAYNARIRKVSPNGIITTVVGGATAAGFSGDGGLATSARLDFPVGVAVDIAGNLFIADPGFSFAGSDFATVDPAVDHRIRRVSPGGVITTIAGGASVGYSGDGGPGAIAALDGPMSVAVDRAGNVYVADFGNNAVRVLRPTNHSVGIGAVVDAASQQAAPVSPGKIVVIYGAGLGPAQLAQNQPAAGRFGTAAGGTMVSFNGIAAPVLYASATQLAAIVPYAISGASAQVTVTYQGDTSDPVSVPVAPSAPGFFTTNQTGAGQAAAINAVDGTFNTAANPVKVGGYISLYATGEGQTSPGGVDGKVEGSEAAAPVLSVSVTVAGIPAFVQFAGGVPGQVAGLMQINVLIPAEVQPGGYVPVVLQVGNSSTAPDAVWIAVGGK